MKINIYNLLCVKIVMYYIYKLTDCNGLTYYGSSVNVDERFKGHKCHSNNCSSNKLDRLSMEVEVIETLPEHYTNRDARIRERWYFDNNECINEHRPFISDEERIQQRTELMKEYNNRPDVIEKHNTNRQKPEVKARNNKRQKEYDNRPEIKEKKKEYLREYYNKPDVKERKKEQYNQKKEINLMGLEDKY